MFDGKTLPKRAEIHSREGPGKCCHYFISHFPSEKLAPEDARDEGKGGHPSGDTCDVGSEGEARWRRCESGCGVGEDEAEKVVVGIFKGG